MPWYCCTDGGQNQYMMKFLQDHLCDTFTVINLDLPSRGGAAACLECRRLRGFSAGASGPSADHSCELYRSFLRSTHCTALCMPREKMVLTGAAGIQAKRGLGYHIRVKTYKLLKTACRPRHVASDYVKCPAIMKEFASG